MSTWKIGILFLCQPVSTEGKIKNGAFLDIFFVWWDHFIDVKSKTEAVTINHFL